MNANATRDVAARPSVVAPLATKMSEAVLPIMQYVGICRLDVRRREIGGLYGVTGEVVMFDGVPDVFREYAYAIKDSLAAIVASTGVTSLEMSADAEELKALMDGYLQLAEMYKAAKISSDEARAETAHGPAAAPAPAPADGAGASAAEKPHASNGKCKCGGRKCPTTKKRHG